MKNPTMTKKELIDLGYGKCSAADIIKQAKHRLVAEGVDYYTNSRTGRVPVKTVEAILGITITPEIGEA